MSKKSIFLRISGRIKMTIDFFKVDIKFSFKYAFLRLVYELGGRVGFSKLADKAGKKKDKWLISYLEKNLDSVIQKHTDCNYTGEYQENAPIWVCWWTGEDAAPDLVKKCIKSIRENAGKHPVNLITKDTFQEYLSVPSFIMERFLKGDMCAAHFADYLRVCLLATYGGLWLDATIFCNGPVCEDYFKMPFFTLKSECKNDKYLSKYRWATFCFGGYKNSVFYNYLKESFEEYWKDNRYAIDYLFFDAIVLLGYERIPAIKILIDDVPISNIHRDDLQAAMNEALPADEFENIINEATNLYKLSWRETYSKTTADGEQSVYGYFLSME